MTVENNIPKECEGCTLSGMAAINCQTFLDLTPEVEMWVQCYPVQYSSVRVAGGRYVSGPGIFNRKGHGLGVLPKAPQRTQRHGGRKIDD